MENRLKFSLLTGLALILAAALAACGPQSPEPAAEGLEIVVTTTFVGDVVGRAVACAVAGFEKEPHVSRRSA